MRTSLATSVFLKNKCFLMLHHLIVSAETPADDDMRWHIHSTCNDIDIRHYIDMSHLRSQVLDPWGNNLSQVPDSTKFEWTIWSFDAWVAVFSVWRFLETVGSEESISVQGSGQIFGKKGLHGIQRHVKQWIFAFLFSFSPEWTSHRFPGNSHTRGDRWGDRWGHGVAGH